eukprot:65722_1
MYSKCHQLLKASSISLSHRISKRLNTTTNATFKYSANLNQKDCIRLAFIYGMCGTFASYLSMNYDGKVLVFKWSVPTPERFVFCTWCWATAGMTSWVMFWTKPGALVRAAASRVRYGLLHGTQTTSLAMILSFGTIATWSIYFDVTDWQNRYGEWQKSLTSKPSNPTLMTDIPNRIIEEQDNEEGESQVSIVNIDEMDGTSIVNHVLETKENKNNTLNKRKVAAKMEEIIQNKPILTYQILTGHMYEPCKLFFLCNAPIWLICGSVTGIVAARVLTNAVLLNPVNISTAMASMCRIERNSTEFELLH